MKWEDSVVKKLKTGFAKEGKFVNMCILHMKDGTQQFLPLMAPTEELHNMVLTAMQERVKQHAEKIEEVALIMNALSEEKENFIVISFESRKEVHLRKFSVKGKKLKEEKHDEKLGLVVGLYVPPVEFNPMYG